MKIVGLKKFIDICRKAYPKEAVGYLFRERDVLTIYPVKCRSDSCSFRIPKKEQKKINSIMGKEVGIIHSHPLTENGLPLDFLLSPSDEDLIYMKKSKHTIMGIVAIDSRGRWKLRIHNRSEFHD